MRFNIDGYRNLHPVQTAEIAGNLLPRRKGREFYVPEASNKPGCLWIRSICMWNIGTGTGPEVDMDRSYIVSWLNPPRVT